MQFNKLRAATPKPVEYPDVERLKLAQISHPFVAHKKTRLIYLLQRCWDFLKSDAPGLSRYVDLVVHNGVQPGQKSHPWRES